VLLRAAALWLATCPLAQAVDVKRTTEPAPPVVLRTLALETLDGSALDLNALHGRVVIVHFFATWCEPCREELPALQRLAARSGKPPVTVIAIAVADPELRVRRFLHATPVDFPVVLDQDRAVAKAWDISELPSTVILDPELRPRLAAEGDFAWDQIDSHTLVEMLDPNYPPPNTH
jgi:thiol-disulfide isomerase/thioredoxin